MSGAAEWADPDATYDLFVDRVDEARALDSALREHRARIEADTITPRELRNVLTYYGDGGVGKTALSSRLTQWLKGELDPLEDEWGTQPPVGVDAIVRWDQNDSYGAVDVVELLVALRARLGAIRKSWPAFDLAFAEFFRLMRPGQDLRFRTPGHGETTLAEVVGGLVTDAIAVSDVAISGGLGAGTFGIARRVLAGSYARSKARRTMAEFPQVAEILRACDDLPGTPRDVALTAARLCFLFSCEIQRMEPTERPTVVIFVDHMERLQVPGRNHLGEWTLNKVIARLPYFLFVITGRNSLEWHDPAATHLDERGRTRWPLLPTDPTPSDEPRQHRIGNLSAVDAARFLQGAFAREGVLVEDALVAHLARSTDGWPLHLDTLVAVAGERQDPVRALTAEDLAGPLPSLVDRLLHDLPADEADAFRAACLLPYFDVDLVAAAGSVPRGAVERLIHRTIVRPNLSSPYPFRVHETIRELVRAAGASSDGGWADGDWVDRAERALSEAAQRFEASMESHDDIGALESLALGLNVAAENGVDGDWLVPAIRRSPSISGLSLLLPATDPAATTADVADILRFLRLRTPTREDVTDALRDLVEHRTSISTTAGLWRAYDLRFRGRTDEAVAQFDVLLSEFGDRPELYSYQRAVTLRLARRFHEALAQSPTLNASQQERLRAGIRRSHGAYTGDDARELLEIANRQTRRRFQMELLSDWLVVKHRETGVPLEVAVELYDQADLIGHQVAKATIIGVIAQSQIYDDAIFEARLAELEELSNRRSRPYTSWTMVLAMRAWARDEPEHARRAQEIANSLSFRSSSYIATEILLEELGYPVTPQPTQWLEPYADVRKRWLTVLAAVKDRAAGRRE